MPPSNRAPDLNSLLSKPLDSFTPPPTLPAGTWKGIIGPYSYDKSAKKKTDFVRYLLNITGPGDDIDEGDLEGVEWNGKQLKKDFYLTQDALFRLTDFISSLGIEILGRSVTEMIPEAVGIPVLITVTEDDSEDGKTKYNNVGLVVGE
jgi:hypothetical protein